METLFLCHRIPYPPDKGDKIRSYHLLVALAKKGPVDLVTHVDDPRDLRHRQLLADLCRSVEILPLNPWIGKVRAARALFSGAPLSVAYLTRDAGRRFVADLVSRRRYDAVVAFSSQAAAYLDGLTIPPFVMDLVDVDSAKWAQYGRSAGAVRGAICRLEGRRMRAAEARIGALAARVVLTTDREVALYKETVGVGEALAIPNGVVLPASVPSQAERKEPLLVFVGAMDYPPNVEAAEAAARRILPAVRARVPEARLAIVGRNPTPRVSALATEPGVLVTGEVADLGPWLLGAMVSVVPLRVARGVQNKVLEALAHGIPVVAAPGVASSLHPDSRGCVLSAETEEKAAEAAIGLLLDPGRRDAMGREARAFVRAHHDWRSFDAAWEALLLDVTKAAAGQELSAAAGKGSA